jgi:spore coat protein U-like protein
MILKTIRIILLGVAAAILFAAGNAEAQGTTSRLINVTARVNSRCTVTGSTNINSLYDPAGADVQVASGTVLMTCTKNTVPTVTISGGDAQVLAGPVNLNYTVTRDLAGLTTFGTWVLPASTGKADTITIPVNAAISYGADPDAGDYAGSFTVSIAY